MANPPAVDGRAAASSCDANRWLKAPGLQSATSQEPHGIPGDVLADDDGLEVRHPAADGPGHGAMRALIRKEPHHLAVLFQHGDLHVAADRSHGLGELGTEKGTIQLGPGALDRGPGTNVLFTQLVRGNDRGLHRRYLAPIVVIRYWNSESPGSSASAGSPWRASSGDEQSPGGLQKLTCARPHTIIKGTILVGTANADSKRPLRDL